MKPSEIIDKALTEVMPDASKWCQGAYSKGEDEDEQFCILGALWRVAEIDQIEALIPVIRGHIPNIGNSPLSIWNDSKGRTYDEVHEVMEKARAGLQEAGQ